MSLKHEIHVNIRILKQSFSFTVLPIFTCALKSVNIWVKVAISLTSPLWRTDNFVQPFVLFYGLGFIHTDFAFQFTLGGDVSRRNSEVQFSQSLGRDSSECIYIPKQSHHIQWGLLLGKYLRLQQPNPKLFMQESHWPPQQFKDNSFVPLHIQAYTLDSWKDGYREHLF